MHWRILDDGISAVASSAWNRLSDEAYPYLRHEFLWALEAEDCLGEQVGWEPRHLVIEAADGSLLGGLPMYLKHNSFGEFVFDWAWADAHHRVGLSYYPKLVIASPFTPATGPRLLLRPELRHTPLAERVTEYAIEAARRLGVSSLHWLFASDQSLTEDARLMRRTGCQFHWHNRDYESFDDFLAGLTSKRRKEILRERRMVREAGVELIHLSGLEVSKDEWRVFHALYRSTFDKHGNYPALTLGFFRRLATTLGEQVRLVMARRHGQIIAVAFFLVGADCLYGRYWGCREELPGLHFEACYYQGIEFCIDRRLSRFEPGAQGEHKISRGFLPSPTFSYHWVAHEGFRKPIMLFLQREQEAMDEYMQRLMERSPYRRA